MEYIVPNFIPFGQKIDQITVSLEISSEAPGINDVWPSDISFKINGQKIATWTSPGDFGSVRGIFTPDWWYPNWNQYGLLKILVINKKGTFIDGLQVSDVSIHDFQFDYRSTIKLKLEVEENAEHVLPFSERASAIITRISMYASTTVPLQIFLPKTCRMKILPKHKNEKRTSSQMPSGMSVRSSYYLCLI